MPLVKSRPNDKTMDDVTSLDALLPSPQGPQSVPPVMGASTRQYNGHSGMAPSFNPSLPAMKFLVSNTTTYIAFFLAAAIISLSMPRNLLLQYVPHAYTTGGVVSWTGAAILGAAAVVLAHSFKIFLTSLFA